MGNNISGATTRTTVGALDSYVSELGADIIYEKGLGTARFLKTVKGKHKNGPLVIKIFIKPDPGLSLRLYERRLKIEREALANIPNIYSYQSFVETEKAGYIIRQWLASSLYDRISTRPFLSTVEKKWIAFQILIGLQQARTRNISHGDIKSENILVTSWNWVYITDFSSMKPVYLPLDDPTDYSFYFDTSGRRSCYIAPERFFTEGSDISKRKTERESNSQRDGSVKAAMDVFSVGCVIAEMFLEGRPTFTLASLYEYKKGELKMDSHLSAIEDEGIRSMVASMIVLNPSERPTLDKALETARGTVFPEFFYSFLHAYIRDVNDLSVPVTSPSSPFNRSHNNPTPGHVLDATSSTATTGGGSSLPSSNPSTLTNATTLPQQLPVDSGRLPNDSDTRIDRIWSDFEEVEPYLIVEDEVDATVMAMHPQSQAASYGAGAIGRPLQDIIPVELHIPKRTSKLWRGFMKGQKAAAEDGPALILLSLVCSNIRNCTLPSSKLHALDILLSLACYLTDEAKLERTVPYVLELLHDEAPSVRGGAIRTLMQILMLVSAITPANSLIFPEYIFPNIRHLANDPDVSVRSVYAQCIVPLTDTSAKYLEMNQALKTHGAFGISTASQTVGGKGGDEEELGYHVPYSQALQDLESLIQEQLVTLLVDPSSVVKRSILHNISELAVFFKRQKTNDVLLSHVITYLNDRDWMLRWDFFDSIVGVAACVGSRSLEEYILPLMIQALSDVEEAVVAKVLTSLTSLTELSLFPKMRLWELLSATIGFLYHPNIWIKQGAAAFIAAAAKKIPRTDIWCILYPSLRSLLRSDVTAITERSLMLAVKPPLPRSIFDAAVVWAMKSEKSVFWRRSSPSTGSNSGPRSRTTSLRNEASSGKESLVAMRKSAHLGSAGSTGQRSEEDEVQLQRLQQLGMSAAEEAKLVALRDYIVKLANANMSFLREKSEPRPSDLKDVRLIQGTHVELQKLGIVPETVFVGGVQKDRFSRVVPSRTSTTDGSSRRTSSGLPGSPRLGALHSIDATLSSRGDGTVVEDLRRRLAQMDGSTTSLTVPQQPSPLGPNGTLKKIARRDSISSLQTNLLYSPTPTDTSSFQIPALPSPFDVSPSSPSESVLSGGIDVLRRKHQRAAPAMVGSTHANAHGTLENPKLCTSEDESAAPSASGRTSPNSVTGTIRGQSYRSRRTSLQQFTTYEGQEPGINNALEAVYQDNFKDPTSDFGPRVPVGQIRRRNPTTRLSLSASFGSSKRPEATLIAHLTSHTGPINGIAVAPDHTFFVSCSDDKTVKVWDTARLERSVTSKPRHTHTQHHAKVTCVCMLEATHCFASAAEDGSLHVIRVSMTQASSLPKYKPLQVVREHRVDHPKEYITCMIHYNTDTTSNLVYCTSLSTIVILDLRTMRILLTMENSRHFGPISAVCMDRKRAWLLTGTMSGVLTLWDIRFGLRLKSWKCAAASEAPSPGHTARIHQCLVHPTKGRGRWVLVAVESQTTASKPATPAKHSAVLIEVWDLEKSQLVETYVTQETNDLSSIASNDTKGTTSPSRATSPRLSGSVPPQKTHNIGVTVGVDAEKTPAAAIAALVQARLQQQQIGPTEHMNRSDISGEESNPTTPQARPSHHVGVRAVLAGVDFGGTGGTMGRLGLSDADSLYGGIMAEKVPGSSSARDRGGWMSTGSEDRKIRLWDLGRVERSILLSAQELLESEKPVFRTIRPAEANGPTHHTEFYSSSNLSGSNRPPLRTNLITHHQQQLLKPHQDVITALACIDLPFRGGIISGDRAGVLKVFRVEGD